MPDHCVAFNCTSRRSKASQERNITFHKFPLDEKRKQLWIKAVRRATKGGGLWSPNARDVLCSEHFPEKDFDRTGQTVRLRGDAVPVKFDFSSHLQPEEMRKRSEWLSVATSECEDTLPAFEGKSTLPVSPEDIAQEHCYRLPEAHELKRRLNMLNQQRERLEKQLKNTREREKRVRLNGVALLNELKEKNLLTEELQAKLEAYADFPVDLFERPVFAYSEEQRSFALTLHLYSPKAYNYLQNEVKVPLPHPRSLCRWLQSTDEGPGFNVAVLGNLKHKCETSGSQYTGCSLMIGAMALRQHIDYDQKTGHVTGFVDLGQGEGGRDGTEEAREALVFMVVGMTGYWKAPIAYFLTRTVSAQVQCQLVLHALQLLHSIGLVVHVLTMDCHATNVSTSQLLGCSLNPFNLRTSFTDPASEREVFVMFDVCHMLKLVSNMLQSYQLVESPEGKISSHYLKDLQKIQEYCGLRAGNQLMPQHIQFKSQKMKVGLAAQVLSNSMAKSLRLAHALSAPGYEECLQTAYFIEVFASLSDIFNSRNLKCHGNQTPISFTNKEEVCVKLQEARQYILSLHLSSGIPLHSSRRYMSVVGFLTNIESLLGLIPNLLESQKFILTYKFSQDHLELYFSALRRAGGWNNNPTCREFAYTFRELLVRSGIMAGKNGNVIAVDGTSHLGLDNSTTLLHHGEEPANVPSPFEDDPTTSPVEGYAAEHKYNHYCAPKYDLLVQNIVVFIAGFIVRKVSTKIACETCSEKLVSSHIPDGRQYGLLSLKDNGGLVVPSEGVVSILLTAEKVIRRTISVLSALFKHTVLHTVKREYGGVDLFALNSHIQETQHGIDNHYFNLIELIVDTYCSLRQQHIASVHTPQMKCNSLRQKLTKLILFTGD